MGCKPKPANPAERLVAADGIALLLPEVTCSFTKSLAHRPTRTRVFFAWHLSPPATCFEAHGIGRRSQLNPKQALFVGSSVFFPRSSPFTRPSLLFRLPL